MSRTVFGPGVLISSTWLNGAKGLNFRNEDVDWSYPKLTIEDLNLVSIGTSIVLTSTEQTVNGLKSFITLPQSSANATQPNDFVTLKDLDDTLRVTCASPNEGDVIYYDSSIESWKCSPDLNGGTY